MYIVAAYSKNGDLNYFMGTLAFIGSSQFSGDIKDAKKFSSKDEADRVARANTDRFTECKVKDLDPVS